MTECRGQHDICADCSVARLRADLRGDLSGLRPTTMAEAFFVIASVELARRKRWLKWWRWLWRNVGLEEGKAWERSEWANTEKLRARWRALPKWMQRLEAELAERLKDDLAELESLIEDLERTAANPEERLGPYGESVGDI